MSIYKKKTIKLSLSQHEAIYVLACLMAVGAADGLSATPNAISDKIRSVADRKKMSDNLKQAVAWAYSKTTLMNLEIPEESVIDQLIESIDG